jgi:hypothetical protein
VHKTLDKFLTTDEEQKKIISEREHAVTNTSRVCIGVLMHSSHPNPHEMSQKRKKGRKQYLPIKTLQ